MTITELKTLVASTFTSNGVRGIKASDHRVYENTMINTLYIPVGIIVPFAGLSNNIPNGWHKCDGTLLAVFDYPELHTALGGYSSPYGHSSDSTSFYLPNLTPYMSIVQGGTRIGESNPTSPIQGSTGGEQKHSLSIEEMPAHQHVITYPTYLEIKSQSGSATPCWSGVRTNTSATAFTGGSEGVGDEPAKGTTIPHNNMPPYIAMNYIIKLQ